MGTYTILAILGAVVVLLSLFLDGVLDIFIPDDFLGFPVVLSCGIVTTAIGCSGALGLGAGLSGAYLYALEAGVSIAVLAIFIAVYYVLKKAGNRDELDKTIIGKDFFVRLVANGVVIGNVRFRGANVEYTASKPDDEVTKGDIYTVVSDVRPFIQIKKKED